MHSEGALSSNPNSTTGVEAVGSMRQGMDMRTNTSSSYPYVAQRLSHAGEQVFLPSNVERSQTADHGFMRPMFSAPFIGSGAEHTAAAMSLPLPTMDRSFYSSAIAQREQNRKIGMSSRVSRATVQESIARAGGATHDLAPHSRSAHTQSGQNSVDTPQEVQIYTTAMATRGPNRGQVDATQGNTHVCGNAYPPRSQADVDAYAGERSVSDVSTLFMAGFPDDITDREFANMFLFAKGFEASMLKYPSKEGQSGANRDAQDGNSGSAGGRNMQTIGFAKFSSREEALNARDLLNGFCIDQDRGFILKAELAKKNLHQKRILMNDMPRQNNSSTLEEDTEMHQFDDAPDLQKLLERIRARYKLSVDSLGHGMNAKQQMAQVAGQFVDVNQLRY
ncbi:hypothetical protein MVES_000514 [Malassezia vespertilionis]|uniref:RRM domain-containing protein n=1 Tax=Malassezia vespertilionis TaxID=2020962 RepID=A0A2N1JH38_9BASI|nr:hypothetical protein MVES_000514 [Malassezia vespertilionis]